MHATVRGRGTYTPAHIHTCICLSVDVCAYVSTYYSCYYAASMAIHPHLLVIVLHATTLHHHALGRYSVRIALHRQSLLKPSFMNSYICVPSGLRVLAGKGCGLCTSNSRLHAMVRLDALSNLSLRGCGACARIFCAIAMNVCPREASVQMCLWLIALQTHPV